MEPWVQIIVTIIGVLGSSALWKYMEVKLKQDNELKKEELLNSDSMQFRDDLKSRVRNLESLLASSAGEKDQLREQVLKLTAEVYSLRVKVEFLEKENERLKQE